jgi:hypothetical protein
MKLLIAFAVVACLVVVVMIRFAVTERDMEGY